MPETPVLDDIGYLDVVQVSYLYQTSPSALYSQRHRGEMPGALGVRVGRKILWRRSDLDQWFDARKAEQTQPKPAA
jgi:predicted DNA-binding transcriptional regulator AlpA